MSVSLSRRALIGSAAVASLASPVLATPAPAVTPRETGLTSLAVDAKPITPAERQSRIAKLQRLMGEKGVGAMVMESGSSLDYFTGVQWWRSERTTGAVIRTDGPVVIVTPAFEEPSIRETLQVPAEVRPWNEHESPFLRIAAALKGMRRVAFEPTTRLFIVDGVRAAAHRLTVVPGAPFIRACRLIKSPAELALLQTANAITLGAMKYTHAEVRAGMNRDDIRGLMKSATIALGGEPDDGLVLLNEASAYPHGSHSDQVVKDGGVVLLDFGCKVHGYVSDISRTWVVGEPNPRQRTVWATVKQGQEVALEAAALGGPVGRIDDAVRAFYEKAGWGPGYRLPGLPHRTGHGIGLDGHEDPYLVHNDTTPLEPGMCFSDEPGLYIPGEFGVRLEDCWRMTASGPKLFTGLAHSIADPI